MHCGFILRNHRPDCSDGILCSGILLGHFFNSVLKLRNRKVCIIIFYQLLELPCGIFSSDDRLFELYIMYSRNILCHHWLDCCDGYLRCRVVLGRFFYSLFELLSWEIFIFGIFN